MHRLGSCTQMIEVTAWHDKSVATQKTSHKMHRYIAAEAKAHALK